MYVCENGHEVPEGNAFCGMCGSAVTAAPATPPPPVAPVAGHGDSATGTVTGPPVTGGVPGFGADASPGTADGAAGNVAGRKPRRKLVPVTVAFLAVGAVAVAALLVNRSSREDDYLAALADAGLSGEFSTERAAVRSAERLCEDIDDGADPAGSDADRIGVDHYCPSFSDDFDVLDVAMIDGTFTIIDGDSAGAIGSSCSGAGGYGDVNSSTQVVVRNDAGDVLARTELGSGTSKSPVTCVFSFDFEITEGEENYVVAVGDRGEVSYTFAALRDDGIDLSLG